MHQILKVCFFVGLLFPYSPVLAQGTERPIIVLDPGHGGRDPGAIGINGIKEKDIALKVAKEVIRLNRELYNDWLEIYLTRYSDTLISLGHRTDLAKTLRADVFISIHFNQAGRKTAQGIEVFVYKTKKIRNRALQSESKNLAVSMLMGFEYSLGFKNRGVKHANFQVLRDLRSTCPAILLELGFLSNPQESGHSNKKSSITAYAMVMLQTLIEEKDAGNF